MGQDFRSPRGARDFVDPGRGEIVARVEVTVSVFGPQIGAVQRDDTSIFGNFIEFVAPGVGQLSVETVPAAGLEGSLQRIVIRSADAVQLVDVPEVRILRGERPRPASQGQPG